MSEQSTLTPMMKQYVLVKSEAPEDAILLFRLGDFYEMFHEDAKRASAILEIALTKRAGYPMCGIPFHAIDNYLPKLLEAGVKVAIAEQLEDPALAKGIVKRSITRVITPGTVMDSSVLAPGKNNFLAALVAGKDSYGVAYLDISTGEFCTSEAESIAELEALLYSLQVKECLLPESLMKKWEEESSFPYSGGRILWTPLEEWICSEENTLLLLHRQFGVSTMDGFGLRGKTLALRAAGAVLHYASENLRHNVGHIRSIHLHVPDRFLSLDPICQRNLELVEPMFGAAKGNTLLSVLDHTRTPMGSRMMRSWILKPLRDVEGIIERQDVVGHLKDDPLTLTELRETMGAVRDLERIVARLNVGSANPRDLLSLSGSLEMLPPVKLLLSDFADLPLAGRLKENIVELPELAARLAAAIVDEPPALLGDGGYIRSGYNAELDELRSAATDGKKIVAALQAKEQERTGIKNLKVNFNKVFGYYIEVTKSNLDLVPPDYIRKQTLVNNERFITPELKEMESRILGAEEKSKALEAKLFEELKEFARSFTGEIQKSAVALAEIDVLCALAEYASKNSSCRPRISDDDLLDIKGGRHPVLDANMKEERFVPNDVLLDGDENRLMVITGPNMAGKSTYIRQTALLVIMAQMGAYIPADSAHIGVADRIFTRVGASDDLARGQSTFMVEMVETANILNNATSRSIVILDEIGRGTSTFDGLSIAWAVAEYLVDHPSCRARTQFATHYHELTELAMTRRGVKNYNVAVREYGEKDHFPASDRSRRCG
ncbi:MAG: DNA mismatch repair protein MutS [Lentisphaeria bacterium]|nr:DNA mismatch repair protein MutS [Lentisphaeria bacterium]